MHWRVISPSANLMILLVSLLAVPKGLSAQDAPIKCGDIPQMGQDLACSKPATAIAPDKRECRKHILGLSINDPVCEVEKAAANGSRQAGIAEANVAYQSCIANLEAMRAINRAQLSTWLSCAIKEEPITNALIGELAGYQTCRRDHQSDWQAFCCTPLSSKSRALVSDCR
jgi:hypothetical protein